MKRFHVHLSVPDLAASVRFYSGLFGAAPTVEKPDYAKWMLEEPRVNFAISHRSSPPGIAHLGLQADSPGELAEIRSRFAAVRAKAIVDEPGARCCYAVSDKHWITDPQGIAWEAFHTLDAIPAFDAADTNDGVSARCCASDAGSECGPAPDGRSSDGTAAPGVGCG